MTLKAQLFADERPDLVHARAASVSAQLANTDRAGAGTALFSAEGIDPVVADTALLASVGTGSDSQFAQRAFDLLFSISFLIVLAPVMAIGAVSVWISGPGPIIFRQPRIGLTGRSFVCLKFRTMEHEAERLLPHLIASCGSLRDEWDSDQKLRCDPRVTPVGRLLRNFSIDELPQLINVLRGEMSLVGPRPIVQSEIVRYGRGFEDYCRVKPGITGLWQISGRNDVSYTQRVRLDGEYARSKSVIGDLGILIRTIPVVLRGTGY